MVPQDFIQTPQSSRIFSVEDAQRIARRRLPRMVYDFITGSAGREVAAPRNCAAFDGIELQPRVLASPPKRVLTTSFLGKDYGLPIGVSPMGMCNLIHPRADQMIGQVARDLGVPACLSTAGSSRIEDMAKWAGPQAWFQLYVVGTIEHSLSMVDRAKASGYETLVLTVDVPQVSRRVRDLRNGFKMPFRLGPKQLLDLALHPQWSLSTLANGAPKPLNINDGEVFDREASRAGADWDYLDRLRDLWPGKLIVKGLTHPGDAVRVRDAGADAVWVSNHGGRQLDSAPPAISVLPGVRAAVGPDYPLVFDSGIRSGEDVVKAMALGADFVMTGRPWLYAIGAEGERGLRAAFQIFAHEISLTLAQIGLGHVGEIGPSVLLGSNDAPKAPPIKLAASGGV